VIIADGWYQGALAADPLMLGSVRLPPLLWVWWMRPTAAPLVWATLAAMIPDHAASLRAGAAAAVSAAQHAERLAALAPPDPTSQQLALSAAYLRDALAIAQTIRATFLPAYQAVAENHYDKWRRVAVTAGAVIHTLETIRARWVGRVDFPPLEIDELVSYLRLLQSAPRPLWLQARGAGHVVRYVKLYGVPTRERRTAGAAFGAIALLLLSRGRYHTALSALVLTRITGWRRGTPMRPTLPHLNAQLYLLPSIFFETGPALGEWTAA
jgi:hypothetical protein